jgi:hypothetical protein
MVKRTDTITSPSWLIYDTARVGYNGGNSGLFAETSTTESSTNVFDILSNGFKARSADGVLNGSGGTYIYAAFAENPFKNSLAR